MPLVKSCAYNIDSGRLETEDVDGVIYSVDVLNKDEKTVYIF